MSSTPAAYLVPEKSERKTFVSDSVLHMYVNAILAQENVWQYPLKDIIRKRKELDGSVIWLREDETFIPGRYEITTQDTGAYEPVSKVVWETLDPEKRLRIYKYDPRRPLAAQVSADGISVIDNPPHEVAHVAGEKQTERSVFKGQKRE